MTYENDLLAVRCGWSTARLELQPVTFAEAADFVNRHHRHHIAPRGHRFCIGLNDGHGLVGVVIVGRPVARHLDDGWTAEVTRCCVLSTVPNACSKLYAAAWRAARAMGYRRIVTYTLASESGVAMSASGWRVLHQTKGRTWNCKSRPRTDKHQTEDKLCWVTP